MEKDLRELESILNTEQDLFSVYLEMLTEQQKHLIENNLDELNKSIREINILARKILRLERERKEVIKKISEKLRLDEDDISLGNLLARFTGRNSEELERLRNTILDTHVKATVQKERNKFLIKQSMNVIRQTVNYLNEKNNPPIANDEPIRKGEYCDEGKGLLTGTTA
jgi:flagellar biosynthesis chaperone FliJ